MNRLFKNRWKQGLPPHPQRRSDAFTRGILPENIEYQEADKTGVKLWNQWLAMLRDARELGPVLVTSRNSHAILGEFRTFPELIAGPEELNAVDAESSLALAFSTWNRAMAWSEGRGNKGRLYKMEVLDMEQQPFFRISLIQDSKRERFLEWVQTHQDWGKWSGKEKEEPYCGRVIDCLSAERLPHLLCAGHFWNMLEELCFLGVEIQMQASSIGVSQTTHFVVETVREMGRWIFISGTQGCAHLLIEGLAELRWSGPSTEILGRWEVQGITPEGGVAFRLVGKGSLPSFEV